MVSPKALHKRAETRKKMIGVAATQRGKEEMQANPEEARREDRFKKTTANIEVMYEI